jgi:hypothetical protein
MRWWPARKSDGAASLGRAGVATAPLLADVVEGVIRAARDSFAMVTNPKRRRLRKGTGAYHCDYRSVDELRRISRWLEYHSATYGGALNNWSQYLVGEGPAWVPATADKAWNKQAAELLAADFEAKLHDASRRFGWARWLKLLAVSIARDGGMGVLHNVTGSAQLIEGERVLSVDQTTTGQIVNYQVADIRNGFLDWASKRPVSPAMMDYPAITTRVSQDLGIPICFSSLDDHDGISDLWQAEIDSAAEAVRPWLRLEHAESGLPGGMGIPEALAAGQPAPGVGPQSTGGRTVGAQEGWIRTPNGNIMGIPKGLKSQIHQPERPNLDVPEFSKQVMRICCMVLLPYELLYGDQADVSYSNGRSIRKIGNALLNSFRADYLTPSAKRIVLGRLRQHMLADRLPFVADFAKGAFSWPEIPEHDRVKERQADTADLANGTATLKDLVGEQWQDKMTQAAEETRHRARLAAEGIEQVQQLCNEMNARTPGLGLKWSHLVTIGGASTAPGAYLAAATGAAATPVVAPATKGAPAEVDPNAKPTPEPVGAGASHAG